MASANVPVEDSFLRQIEKVRVKLKKKVSRAHQVLQERETALLLELQKLEDTYRGEGIAKRIHELRISKKQNIATNPNYENRETLEQNISLFDNDEMMLEANLRTYNNNMLKRMEEYSTLDLKFVLNVIMLIRAGEVLDCNQLRQPLWAEGERIKTRQQAASKVKQRALSISKVHDNPSTSVQEDNRSLPPAKEFESPPYLYNCST